MCCGNASSQQQLVEHGGPSHVCVTQLGFQDYRGCFYDELLPRWIEWYPDTPVDVKGNYSVLEGAPHLVWSEIYYA